ncbi:MAG: hypothetical protein K0S51_1114 [Bacillales bacterium]|jgi:hypothetical protein|nr:hypothetical protein [Bacillales bacterium]
MKKLLILFHFILIIVGIRLYLWTVITFGVDQLFLARFILDFCLLTLAAFYILRRSCFLTYSVWLIMYFNWLSLIKGTVFDFYWHYNPSIIVPVFLIILAPLLVIEFSVRRFMAL